MRSPWWILLLVTACGPVPGQFDSSVLAGPAAPSVVVLRDVFDRDLHGVGVTLVDWEGYLANPAIALSVQGSAGLAYPVEVTLRGNHPRLYFDLPSAVGASGPSKVFTLANDQTRREFALSIAPDRDATAEEHVLRIELTGADGSKQAAEYAVKVIDHDKAQPAQGLAITLDYSKDQTAFFPNAGAEAVVRQVVADWSEFLELPGTDPVAANDEATFIWNKDGFRTGTNVLNTKPYTGFLLYAYGVHDPTVLRSGGDASYPGKVQTRAGAPLPLKRSGALIIETAGNYNALGWNFGFADDDWWKASMLQEPNEFFSVMRHELGHVLAFHPAHPGYATRKSKGFIDDAEVVAYHGAPVPLDDASHLKGAVDKESRKGAFGNDYYGLMPNKRWVTTKLDLLCAKAMGYALRPTSAFAPVQLDARSPIALRVGAPAEGSLVARGGVPFFDFRVVAGALPAGVRLNRFDGTLEGTPLEAGQFTVEVELRDYHRDGVGVRQPLRVDVAP